MMSINGMISMRARFFGMGEETRMAWDQYAAPVSVKVIGTFTLGAAAPGLNRHCRKALTAALSNIGLPMLCAMFALLTLPLATSTSNTQTPLPVMRRERAS